MKAQIEADRAARIKEATRLALMFKALNDLENPSLPAFRAMRLAAVSACCVLPMWPLLRIPPSLD